MVIGHESSARDAQGSGAARLVRRSHGVSPTYPFLDREKFSYFFVDIAATAARARSRAASMKEISQTRSRSPISCAGSASRVSGIHGAWRRSASPWTLRVVQAVIE